MKFDKAIWHGVRNFTEGGQEQVLGLVVHIMDGTLEGSQAWFNNPDAQASSHFGTGRDGELRQWVDTADRAWAQAAGNRTYLSIENEGRGGDSLTAEQIKANAKVLYWVHQKYGVPLDRADAVGDRGLAYHALGGSAWGGHTSCPGSKVVAQLDEIIAEAKKLAPTAPKPSPVYAPFPGVSFFRIGKKHELITAMGKRLVAEGYKGYSQGPGPTFTVADKKAYAWWQRKLGYSGQAADGIPGPVSWGKLKVPKI